MRNPARTPFVAIFQNEVLLNSKRVAPYALMILFAANAVLWWSHGPAVRLGWATNSDYYIVRNLLGFSFLLGLPIFNAVIMGDSVLRDFRLGVDPLIFSKPVSRAQYLLGKFFGNFFVLVCCQATFPLTLLVLQAFRTSQMIVQPVRVFPYFKHFFFYVVISHLVLAAVYFTAGTLARNTKIVYALAVCFYPIYIACQVLLLKSLAPRWRILLDPFLLNSSLAGNGFLHSADFLNRLVVNYTADMIANRVLVILVTAVFLAILYIRFTISERPGNVEKFSTLNISSATDTVSYDLDSFREVHGDQFEKRDSPERETLRIIPLPNVARANEGARANLTKLTAALGVEFRLLRGERGLMVIAPLTLFLSTFELAFWKATPGMSYSGAYASSVAGSMLLFLLGITVFYMGEAMHRDRDRRIEPVLWSLPIPNRVLLLSKFLSTVTLTCSLTLTAGLIAIALQLFKHETPIEISAYLKVFGVILFPSIIFLAAASLALNVLLRERYVTYVVSIAIGAGLFYLYGQGYRHWAYNPLLYQLWSYADLTNGAGNQARILGYRFYWLAIALLCIVLAHFFYERKAVGKLRH